MSLSQILNKSLPGINLVADTLTLTDPFNIGVRTLDGLEGDVVLTSPQATITITKTGQNIELEAVAAVPTNAVSSLNNLINAVSLTSPNATITVTPNGQTIQLVVPGPLIKASLWWWIWRLFR